MTSVLKVTTLQNLNSSTIITQTNATTLTLGTSGQTISIPVGATLTNNGTASGFGLTWQSVQTTGFTAVKGNAYPCNTTSAGFTVTLPATPTAGDQVQVVDYAGTFDTNALKISPNGNKIEGATDNVLLSGEREGVILTYIDSTQGWIASSGINEGTDALLPSITTVDFLVVAGGGGGGENVGGGGGAGGYRELTSQILHIATNITVTVGAGGAANTSGSNSVFNTITSAGGGKGGPQLENGTAGGSGGGAGGNESGETRTGGAGNTPSTSPSQGNNGGTATTGFALPAAGGGGANAVGGNGAGGTGAGGAGGAGTASSITGTSVTRAGGGGGSQYFNNAGSGGVGGGGRGGAVSPSTAAVSGTVNTGGGGGGRYTSSGGGLGGSGIVIVKYPDTFTITNPGGGLTFSTPAAAGGFKITSFTAGTGNIQLNY
jgi:hypothetical protein